MHHTKTDRKLSSQMEQTLYGKARSNRELQVDLVQYELVARDKLV